MNDPELENGNQAPGWSGKSRGGTLGYRFFIALIRLGNLSLVYFFIRIVAFWYLLFSRKPYMWYYYRKIQGFEPWKSFRGIYRSFYMLGEVLVDKVALLSGTKVNFSFDFEGEEYLRQMSDQGQGGVLIGAHMGNWELAGQLLERIPTPVNIVMLEAEREQIRDLLEKVMVEKNLKVIPQKDDYTHLFLIDEALDRKEFVVIHGDRYLPGAATQLLPFMGRDARFPTGPLYLASKKGVPVSFVFTLKERKSHYHFYATPPVKYPYPSRPRTRREELARMLEDYLRVLENMVRAYPGQWFNFYPFWEEEKKSA